MLSLLTGTLSNKYVLGIFSVVFVLAGVYWYGSLQYDKGYEARDFKARLTEAVLADTTRQQEVYFQEAVSRIKDQAYETQKQTNAIVAAVSNDLDRLRSVIRTQSEQHKAASSSGSIHGASAACWRALDESVSRYTEVATRADEYVERLRVGQNWAKAVSSSP